MYEYPLFEGKPLIPTKDAQREMDEVGIDLWKVKEVLEEGYEYSRSKRAKNIIERCLYRRNKEIRVVVALVEWKEGIFWRIIHVGKTGGH
ncbi:MAG: DUF4258 domain-containing protein [Candidatus Aenigmarchaeota archaeon]|nr:DUF4258 domain-containing protein [Candidatus Aenigmarchaeota archaeon]